jgi:hypothetical protein
MTGKHVELRARQMQHFQGIYSLCSEDLCGSDRIGFADIPALLLQPPGAPVPPGLELYAGGRGAVSL